MLHPSHPDRTPRCRAAANRLRSPHRCAPPELLPTCQTARHLQVTVTSLFTLPRSVRPDLRAETLDSIGHQDGFAGVSACRPLLPPLPLANLSGSRPNRLDREKSDESTTLVNQSISPRALASLLEPIEPAIGPNIACMDRS